MLPVLNLQTNEYESLQKIKLPLLLYTGVSGGGGGQPQDVREHSHFLASTLGQALFTYLT